MRTFLLLASVLMLVSAEPPTSYVHRSDSTGSTVSNGLSFQNVPSVAQLHIPSGGSSQSYSAPSSRSSFVPSAPQAYSAPQNSYGAPAQQQQQQQYVSASRNNQVYSTPQQPQQQQQQQNQVVYSAESSFQSPSYAAPQQSYGAPSGGQSQPQYHSQSQPANVQVSYGAPPNLPPGSSYGPPPIVTGAGPDHEIEYRVVYKPVKAPKPDLVLPPPPPKQKTIVYILVPRIEPPEPIIVPTHAPTPPSKPEVYFIRYKAAKKSKSGSFGNLLNSPSGQYGAPSAPKPVVVDAPIKKREIVRVSSSSSEYTDNNDDAVVAGNSAAFGDRVKYSHSSDSSEQD